MFNRKATATSLLMVATMTLFLNSEEKSTPPARPLPEGPLGEVIRQGEAIVERTTTHELSQPYVGNRLNCTSCHLKNGTDERAAPFLGTATAYPAWSPREGRVITLEDRILNCFMRSCHGTRPPLGSQVSVSIAAYITWLSTDQPIRMNPLQATGPHSTPQSNFNNLTPDLTRGEHLYRTRCSDCHGVDGQGDDSHPPVWGEESFNSGAGLSHTHPLASWLKVAMPPEETDLTVQESLDVAAFINSHDRPKFRLEDHLPPQARLGEYNSKGE